MLDTIVQDLRLAVRQLARRPGYTLVAVATLALGLGLNTAVFSAVQGVLLEPLALPDGERLVALFQAFPERDERFGGVSRKDAVDWERGSRTLSGVTVYSTRADGLTWAAPDGAEKLATSWVAHDFFQVLGMEPLAGRLPTAGEAETDDAQVILSESACRRRFNADPAVVGSSLTLDGAPHRVTAVLPDASSFPSPEVEVWAYLSRIPPESIPDERFVRWLDAVGRLAPGATPRQAEEELSAIAARLMEEYPRTNEGASAVTAVPLREHLVGPVRQTLVWLLAAVGLVLLIACINLAHLVQARGIARRAEMAVRAALGAGRRRLVSQLLVESLLLAVLGAAAGLLLALWGVDLLNTLTADVLPRAGEIDLDRGVLGFAALLTLATTLLFGVGPALRASRPRIESELREGRGDTGGRRHGLRGGLVVAEVALAVVLVVASGLLARSLHGMLTTDSGFAADDLVALSLVVPDFKYPEQEDYMALWRNLLERLEALPGVADVATTKALPLAGGSGIEGASFRVEGQAETTVAEGHARWHPVSPGFFRTAGLPLRAGRDLATTDDAEAPPVTVVNQTFVDRYLGGGDPVGRRLVVAEQTRFEIVGVVADARHGHITKPPEPTLYLSLRQASRRVFTYLVRAEEGIDPASLVPAIRNAVRQVDPEQPIGQLAPLSTVLRESLARPRLLAGLTGGFAALSLLLAALGLYGVLSYGVVRRRREIGIRMALGADGRRVLATVLGRGLALAGAGVALGMGLAAALSRFLEGLLYQLRGLDPWSYLLAAAVLLTVAALACLLPARRAAGTDPMGVLRRG